MFSSICTVHTRIRVALVPHRWVGHDPHGHLAYVVGAQIHRRQLVELLARGGVHVGQLEVPSP